MSEWKNIAYPESLPPEKIPMDRPLGIDFETPGLKDFRPLLLAVAWQSGKQTKSVVYDVVKMTRLQQKHLIEVLERSNSIIAHNVLFELRVLYYWGADVKKLFGKIEDSMIAIAVQDTEQAKGLKENADQVGMTLSTYKESVKAGPMQFIEYCRQDAITCLLLWQKYMEIVRKRKCQLAYEMEVRLVWVVLDMYISGFYMDMDRIKVLYDETKEYVDNLLIGLTDVAGRVINFNSTAQLRDLFYGDLGAEPNPDHYTSGGKSGNRMPGTGVAALQDLVERYGENRPGLVAQKLLEYREYHKFLSTYLGDGFMSHIEPDGRIRTSLNALATASSRFSSNDPNLQNIPSRGIGKRLREAFVPSPGNVLLQIDYSQIEYRFMVHYMQDSDLIEAYRRGEDFHTSTSRAFGVDRSLGKKLNFTLLYGGGVKKLAMTMGIDEDQAREYYNLYHTGLPNLRKFRKQVDAYVHMTGHVKMMSGRCRGMMGYIEKKDGSAERIGVNTIVQGNAGELLKLAMIRIHDVLPSSIKMILQIHDELIFDGPEKELLDFQHTVQEIMETSHELSVPLIAEPKIVNTWAEAK